MSIDPRPWLRRKFSVGDGLARPLQGPSQAVSLDSLDSVLSVDEKGMSAGFVISTRLRDRAGDIVEPQGCLPHLASYAANPQVYFNHMSEAAPIALARKPSGELDLQVLEDRILSRAWFHGRTRESEEVFGLVAGGILKGASVGFVPIVAERIDGTFDETARVMEFDTGGMRFIEWALTEWSVVGVPCNPEAVRRALDKGKVKSPYVVKALSPWAAKASRSVSKGVSLDAVLPPEAARQVPKHDDPQHPASEAMQSFLFCSSLYKTADDAAQWLAKNGVASAGPIVLASVPTSVEGEQGNEAEEWWVAEAFPASSCEAGSARFAKIEQGVYAVACRPSPAPSLGDAHGEGPRPLAMGERTMEHFYAPSVPAVPAKSASGGGEGKSFTAQPGGSASPSPSLSSYVGDPELATGTDDGSEEEEKPLTESKPMVVEKPHPIGFAAIKAIHGHAAMAKALIQEQAGAVAKAINPKSGEDEGPIRQQMMAEMENERASQGWQRPERATEDGYEHDSRTPYQGFLPSSEGASSAMFAKSLHSLAALAEAHKSAHDIQSLCKAIASEGYPELYDLDEAPARDEPNAKPIGTYRPREGEAFDNRADAVLDRDSNTLRSLGKEALRKILALSSGLPYRTKTLRQETTAMSDAIAPEKKIEKSLPDAKQGQQQQQPQADHPLGFKALKAVHDHGVAGLALADTHHKGLHPSEHGHAIKALKKAAGHFRKMCGHCSKASETHYAEHHPSLGMAKAYDWEELDLDAGQGGVKDGKLTDPYAESQGLPLEIEPGRPGSDRDMRLQDAAAARAERSALPLERQDPKQGRDLPLERYDASKAASVLKGVVESQARTAAALDAILKRLSAPAPVLADPIDAAVERKRLDEERKLLEQERLFNEKWGEVQDLFYRTTGREI